MTPHTAQNAAATPSLHLPHPAAALINSLADLFEARSFLELGQFDGGLSDHVTLPQTAALPVEAILAEAPSPWAGSALSTPGKDWAFPTPVDIIAIGGHGFTKTLAMFEKSMAVAHENTLWFIDGTVPRSEFKERVLDSFLYSSRKSAHNLGDDKATFKVILAIHDVYPEYSYCTLVGDTPFTVVWKAGKSGRNPLFRNFDELRALDSFDVFLYPKALMPVVPEVVADVVGMTLSPLNYQSVASKSAMEKILEHLFEDDPESLSTILCWKNAAMRSPFPTTFQRIFLAPYKVLIRGFTGREEYVKLCIDPGDFFAGSKHPVNRLMRSMLSAIGPAPERSDFSMDVLRQLLESEKIATKNHGGS